MYHLYLCMSFHIHIVMPTVITWLCALCHTSGLCRKKTLFQDIKSRACNFSMCDTLINGLYEPYNMCYGKTYTYSSEPIPWCNLSYMSYFVYIFSYTSVTNVSCGTVSAKHIVICHPHIMPHLLCDISFLLAIMSCLQRDRLMHLSVPSPHLCVVALTHPIYNYVVFVFTLAMNNLHESTSLELIPV